jgi:CBS domain containing-hemolysin-like protein
MITELARWAGMTDEERRLTLREKSRLRSAGAAQRLDELAESARSRCWRDPAFLGDVATRLAPRPRHWIGTGDCFVLSGDPLECILPRVNSQQGRTVTGVEEDVIEREERALIHSIIEFGDTVVREVMVPRPDMVALESGAAVGDAMEVAIAAGYSRIPVYEQNIDDITGIVYAKDLMRALREDHGDVLIRDLIRPAKYVPETTRVAELMREMQAEKFHMAIVVDEYGGTAGLATLEDLIEELVGEIVDEFDVEEPLIEPLPGGDVRVNGRMPLDELNELLHADFPEGDWDTVAGLVFNLLGHVPTEGETVEYDAHRFRAEKVQGRRIGRVRISQAADSA